MGINIAEVNLGQSQDLRVAAGGAAMKYAAENDRFYNAGRDVAKASGIDIATQGVASLAMPAAFAGPAGPVAAVGVGVVAGVLKSIFGSHSEPVYNIPAGYDAWKPGPRDWVVVLEALRYVKTHDKALATVTALFPVPVVDPVLIQQKDWSSMGRDRYNEAIRNLPTIQSIVVGKIDILIKALTMKGKKFLSAAEGARVLDKLVIGQKYAGRDISIRGPIIEGSRIHWFEMAAYNPQTRWAAGLAYQNSAIVHACLIQLANAIPAQVWMEEVHLTRPEPRIALTKNLPKKDTREKAGLMPPDWKGNLRFVLAWVEHRQQAIVKGKKPVPYSLKGKDQNKVIADLGGSAVATIRNGMLYRLRPIIVYRAGGKNPDVSGRGMIFLEQFGIAQVPGAYTALKVKAEQMVKDLKKPPKVSAVADVKIKKLTDLAASGKPPGEIKRDVPEPEPVKPTIAVVEAPDGKISTQVLTPSVAEKAVEKKTSMVIPALVVGGIAIGALVLLTRK